MRRRRWRGYLSATERDELWRRWRHGDAINAIAGALDRRHSVVQRVLAGTGGFTLAATGSLATELTSSGTPLALVWLMRGRHAV